jgi:hypothetical protein
VDLIEPDVELLRRDLHQRRENPLTEFGLAGEHGHRFVRLQSNPPIQPSVIAQAKWQCSRSLAKHGVRCQGKWGYDDTKRLREASAR